MLGSSSTTRIGVLSSVFSGGVGEKSAISVVGEDPAIEEMGISTG
jgi:hypothetical protein